MINLPPHWRMGLGLMIVAFSFNHSFAQFEKLPYRERLFQLSFFPGISTNGLGSAMYYNKFSLNLTSGLSAGNHYFELGVISNTHTRSSGGIQLAGLANIVGSNSYVNMTLWEINALIKDGDRSDLNGIQFSGMLNFVRNNVHGFQLTGGFNVNNGNAQVIQLAGVSNIVGMSLGGFQIAGISNIVSRSARGLQLSALFNSTGWELDGVQFAAVNRARKLPGRNSVQMTSSRGFQVGLVNLSKVNDGMQFGLINKTGRFHGTQIGLINIFRPSPHDGSQGRGKYGVPVGLINIGSNGSHTRLYTTELFWTNMEVTTGNCRNCTWTESTMPLSGKYQVMNQNALLFGYNHWENINAGYKWSAGYGFEQVRYNKSSMSKADPNNKRYFISYGLRVQHLNQEKKFDGQLNLLTVVHSEIGVRPTKKTGVYIYGGLTINYLMKPEEPIEVIGIELAKGTAGQLWAGYSVGVQM
ncbi:MAG: hypothetical protein RIC35_01950 [Marinoscillum sp.]